MMKKGIYIFYMIFLIFQLLACSRSSTTKIEREEVIKTIITYEENDPFSLINKCKRNNKYVLYNDYNDTIILDDNFRSKVDSQINIFEIKQQYKREFAKQIDIDTKQFYSIDRIKDFNNKSPCSLSFSRPIKYLGYYFSTIDFNDWASGHSTTYVLKKNTEGKFIIIFSQVMRLN
jgi:hypothetical protein